MKNSNFFKKVLLFLSLSLLSLPSITLAKDKKKDGFTNVYSFGCSFTTPDNSWAALLTKKYGFKFIENKTSFAVDGAGTPGLDAQLQNYKDNVGKFDPNALYMIYMGPNDSSDYTNAFMLDLTGLAFANTGGDIPQLMRNIRDGVYTLQEDDTPVFDNYIDGIGGMTGNFVKALAEGGTKYIMVHSHFNEMYRQPALQINNDAEEAEMMFSAHDMAARAYSLIIAENIKDIAPSANIIWSNLHSLVDEVSRNPTKYFTEDEIAASIAQQGGKFSAFFDDTSHPTEAAHKLLAQYDASIIESPSRIAMVREMPLTSGGKHFYNVRSFAESSLLNPMENQFAVNAIGDYTGSKTDNFSKKDLGFKNGKAIHAGVLVNYKVLDNLIIGGQVNYASTEIKFMNNTGKALVKEPMFSIHGVYTFSQPFFVYGSAGLGRARYTIDRHIVLGIGSHDHKGKTSGQHYFGTLGAGYNFPIQENVSLIPYVNGQYQTVAMKSYTENKSDIVSSRMNFNAPKRKSIIAEAGLTVKGKFDMDNDISILPSITLSYAYEFKNLKKERVKANVYGAPIKPFSMPTYTIDSSSVQVRGEVIGIKSNKYSLGLNAGIKPIGRIKDWSVGLSAGMNF